MSLFVLCVARLTGENLIFNLPFLPLNKSKGKVTLNIVSIKRPPASGPLRGMAGLGRVSGFFSY